MYVSVPVYYLFNVSFFYFRQGGYVLSAFVCLCVLSVCLSVCLFVHKITQKFTTDFDEMFRVR